MEIGQKRLGFDIETQPSYIGKNEFPFTGVIKDIRPEKGKYNKIQYVLVLENKEQFKTRELDLWGDNLAYLVNTLGPSADNWIGKEITVTRGPDLKRVVQLA